MAGHPYAIQGKPQSLRRPNWWQRLLRRPPKQNAWIELRNALCERPIEEIEMSWIVDLERRYGLRIDTAFPNETAAVFETYLRTCRPSPESPLDPEDERRLAHLGTLLRLSPQTRNAIRREVARELLGQLIDEAIRDDVLTDEEEARLESVSRDLGLTENDVRDLYRERAGARIEAALSRAIADERFSPEEEAALEQLADDLRIRLDFSGSTREILDRFRRYWLIESGPLPTIRPGIILQKNETCHFAVDVDWYELRTVTRRIRYAGPTIRIRLAKGIYFRAGDLGVQRVSEDVMRHIDSGRVYITNKRLLFVGSRKNSTIRLNRIIDFQPYENGVQIEKDAGKNPFLAFTRDIDLFVLTLDRVIRDARR